MRFVEFRGGMIRFGIESPNDGAAALQGEPLAELVTASLDPLRDDGGLMSGELHKD
ncbi:hypothetical protein [Sphingomonas alpina]|uniref:Uncharacterized protein n=1 Tax=Sphingomonas alpina TaxID=653931 RepID=A0A7H0LK81_9SPHN|nr:hypothetical protein [Sphingomonas alpina]QNQ10084.1 hypothetical protein H3Z74_02195 [Sphingomonas alpina]